MTNKDQFDNDVVFNSNNILFTLEDDEALGKRMRGFYIKDFYENDHKCRSFIFDNGHQYVLDTVEQMLYVCEPIPEEYFLHKYIEKAVSDFIDKWSISESDIYCSENEIAAKSLIRLLPYRDERIVYLIFICQ